MSRLGRTWPDDWEARRAGAGCPSCETPRGDVAPSGDPRYFAGEWADAFLKRDTPAPGYSVVAWHGRHVADLSEFTPDEAAHFWSDLATVARAITAVYGPCHLNYQFLGNLVPHVHAHVVPRYVNDRAPGTPLIPWEEYRVPEDELAEQVAQLRAHLAG